MNKVKLSLHQLDLLKVEKKLKSYPLRAGGILNAPIGRMKKVTEAEYWDATYGGTHDTMTGLPIGLYEIMLGLED